MRTMDEVEFTMGIGMEWASVLYLFKNHSKLQNYLAADYIDFIMASFMCSSY